MVVWSNVGRVVYCDEVWCAVKWLEVKWCVVGVVCVCGVWWSWMVCGVMYVVVYSVVWSGQLCENSFKY